MDTKIAIIDMGTNTFHLLIAEADKKGYHITHRDRLAVKIGKDGINQGLITEEGIHRSLLATNTEQWKPNASAQPLLEAGATEERRL